jgi:ADP-ribosylglycohydrolase
VVPTVLISLHAFLRTPDDYAQSLRFVISQGGDVDTTGAITGAISGAFNGLPGLPQNLARGVTDRGHHGYQELRALAERLWERKNE